MKSLEPLVSMLKAAGETTRLRILALLGQGDLTVKDFTIILEQSQPRISRHLKILADAGLIDRFPEGSWVYYRLVEQSDVRTFVESLLNQLDARDVVLDDDRAALRLVWNVHNERAARYFSRNATSWDRIRSLHVSEDLVEAAMVEAIGDRRFVSMLDLGTGTGRILHLFADRFDEGLGIDMSLSMLEVARSNLARQGVGHIEVRHGDILDLSQQAGSKDLVTVHQVLHFLDEPQRAIQEAANALMPGGLLILVDFAPHTFEFLRDEHAHRRLGFDVEQIRRWIEGSGLQMISSQMLSHDNTEDESLTVCLWVARKEPLTKTA